MPRPILIASNRGPVSFELDGIHPHDVKEITADTYVELRDLLQHPKVIAVGETGLDYFKNYSPPDLQREHFRKVSWSIFSAKKRTRIFATRDAAGINFCTTRRQQKIVLFDRG